jgi:hypothetical protein
MLPFKDKILSNTVEAKSVSGTASGWGGLGFRVWCLGFLSKEKMRFNKGAKCVCVCVCACARAVSQEEMRFIIGEV